ncbi:MAG TPA: PAS domain S-box protein [Capillimicrobium sp.]|nr:PAS domain S-box protein [Capillimicrobium sp.]
MRANEQQLRRLAESANDIMWSVDRHGVITDVTGATDVIRGSSARDVIGRSLLSLVPRDDRPAAERALREVLAGRTVRDFESRRLRRDGGITEVSVNAVPVFDRRGRVTGATGTTTDISQRKVVERRYRAIVEIADEGVWTFDLEGRITFANQQLADMLGHRLDELVRGRVFDVMNPDDVAAAREWLRSGRGTRPGQSEVELRHADGRTIWARVGYSPLRDDRGQLTGWLGMVTDVTAQREAEERLRRSETHLLEAQRLARVGGWEWDPATDTFVASEEAARIMGRPDDEGPQSYADFLSVIHPDDRSRVERAVEHAYLGRGQYDVEFRTVTPDGQERHLHVRGIFERDEDGVVTRVYGATQDVTERRRVEAEQRLREQHYRDIVETAHDMIWSADADACLTFANPAFGELLGYRPEELIGRPLLDLVEPSMRDAVRDAFGPVFTGGSISLYEMRLVGADGRILDVLANAVGHAGADGRIERVFGTTTDVTAHRRARRELEAAREQFAQAFEHAPIGMALVELDPDRGARALRVNEALTTITGYPAEAVVGRFADEIGIPLADGELSLLRRLLAGAIERYRVEKPITTAQGGRRWLALSVSAVRDEDGGVPYGVLQAEDVTERREYEERLHHLADHDALTDLYNRRRFEAEVRRQLAYAARYDESGAIVVLDLDSFKYANDSFGHQVGDRIIRGVADLLRGRLRETDVLARLGGDEFAVLLPRADRAAAERVAQDLLDAIGAAPIVLDEATGQAIHLTASLGVALFHRTDLSHDDLLALADVAMYRAKEAGRNGYAIADADDGHQAALAERVALMQRVRAALNEDDGFELHAQPIIELASGRATHQEVLLRLRAEDGSLISPATFIPVAEAFGLMGAIDRWVVHAAIELAARQQAAGEDVRLEVNLSASSLADPTFPEAVEQELRRHDVDPSRLIFEVTETAAISNFRQARAFIERLRALGCSFALDDFGAGYGSFRYLKHLPFDLLKIDGDFIRELPRSPRDQLIVRALVQAAQGLGKRTVAEFVSDAETVGLLRAWGVDYGQGFHLAMPGPVSVGGTPAVGSR